MRLWDLKMSHSNISFFVPHLGCEHSCAFCNQNTITGASSVPDEKEIFDTCQKALNEVSDASQTEIAFFGGSFTAIDQTLMTRLLQAAQPFTGGGKFKGIRISTRPDCINEEILNLLKNYNVTAIELGAQSMSDRVLELNERGHTAKDVESSAKLVKKYGFELGLQVMVGLYGSDKCSERQTLEHVLKLKPDTARIYPTCVLEGTKLAQLYRSGEYRLMEIDEVLDICADMLGEFIKNDIKVLRIGLHASEDVEKNLVAGFYHPALGELVRTRLVRRYAEEHLSGGEKELVIYAGKSMVSAAVGHQKSNKLYFYDKGINLIVKQDNELSSEQIRIGKDVYKCI